MLISTTLCVCDMLHASLHVRSVGTNHIHTHTYTGTVSPTDMVTSWQAIKSIMFLFFFPSKADAKKMKHICDKKKYLCAYREMFIHCENYSFTSQFFSMKTGPTVAI